MLHEHRGHVSVHFDMPMFFEMFHRVCISNREIWDLQIRGYETAQDLIWIPLIELKTETLEPLLENQRHQHEHCVEQYENATQAAAIALENRRRAAADVSAAETKVCTNRFLFCVGCPALCCGP